MGKKNRMAQQRQQGKNTTTNASTTRSSTAGYGHSTQTIATMYRTVTNKAEWTAIKET
jgi:hypothetical protein